MECGGFNPVLTVKQCQYKQQRKVFTATDLSNILKPRTNRKGISTDVGTKNSGIIIKNK